jgi:ATP-binding cassette subfamily B protein
MIAKHFGRTIPLEYFRNKTQYGKEGTSLLGLAEAAEAIGLKTVGVKLTFDQLINEAPLPAILHWDHYHYVVLLPGSTKKRLLIADPANGIIKIKRDVFYLKWISTSENGIDKGIALLVERTPHFDDFEFQGEYSSNRSQFNIEYVFKYFKEFKSYFLKIFLGLLIGSIIQLIFPYLTQSIVDTGVNGRDLNFIQIVLAAQLMLLFSQTIVEFIQSRILLHISTKINISLLSSFWSKLLKLPIQFFDSKHPGDIIQRIGDHHRIEQFLTGTALNSIFSIFNIIVFSIVLISYNVNVFFIYISGSVLYLIWIRYFLKFRRNLDYQRFSISSSENNATMQLVFGMQEIKLNNAEHTFRWAWEGLQAKLFKLNFKSLSISQYQQIGAFFINQGKNILITYLVAMLVIDGKLTMGMMLAIQYIIGQLNSPIEQLIAFTQQAQDAKISLERLNDIHMVEDEESSNFQYSNKLPLIQDIKLKNVTFSYPGVANEPVLKNINLIIPHGKTTAIVGMSGSGKSTLVKLLLRFYENYTGDIHLGPDNFKSISPKFWRGVSGAVLQESFIFNDNILRNISVTNENVDFNKLKTACQMANILSFIENLPLGFYTKIGAEGNSISGGQKQRICIARAVYKNPNFIFFDEATNSLDANNERMILENMLSFLKGKTVVVIAHRLSTVKNADKIVVLDEGRIIEEGNHEALIERKGKYFELVKNQLELGL